MRHAVLLSASWIALGLLAEAPDPGAPARAPAVSSPASTLDHGLLDPAWFGPGFPWTRAPGVDYGWVRPGARLDRPLINLAPWELPRFMETKDALDHALAGEVSEDLQGVLREGLGQWDGVQLARDPADSPYHAVGRVVEATHIREGAQATFGVLAGVPTWTWEFKVVDVRTGETLLATHHRAVGAGHSGWLRFVTETLAELAGLPRRNEQVWAMPAEARALPGGIRCWSEPGFTLDGGAIDLLPWKPDTDSNLALWRSWTSNLGQALASAMRPALAGRLEEQGFGLAPATAAAYRLQGRVFTAPRHLKTRYQAFLVQVASGRVVARFDIPAPVTLNPPPRVAALLAERLSELRGAPAAEPAAARPQSPAVPLDPWTAEGPLKAGAGALEAVWVSPDFRLRGRALQVADWLPPCLSRQSEGADRAFAFDTTRRAPGWLLGALVPFQDQDLRLSRTGGDLRLEGRVVEIREADLLDFGTRLAVALTLGAAGRSTQVFQIRVVDPALGRTLLLAQQQVVSFKLASSGTDYKVMKWLAQDFAPWLVKAGALDRAGQ